MSRAVVWIRASFAGRVLSLLALTLLLAPAALADPEPKASLDDVLRRMAYRDHAGALEVSSGLSLKGDDAALLQLLRARALAETGKAAEGLAAAQRVASGDSRWATGGAMLAAELQIALGKPGAAAKLIGAARRDHAGDKAYAALAARYRALAAQVLAGKTELASQPRERAALAAELFAAAGRVEPDLARRRGDVAREASELQASGQLALAIRRWSQLIDDPAAEPEVLARALFGRGSARLTGAPAPQRFKRRQRSQGPIDAARGQADLRDLLDDHPKSPWAARALLTLGRFRAAQGGEAGHDWAQRWWQQLLEQHPSSEQALAASLELAALHSRAQRHREAAAQWDRHAKRHAGHESAAEASFQAGASMLRAGAHAEARQRLTAYLKDNPTGKRWQDARKLLEDSGWLEAEAAAEAKRWADADKALAGYLTSYPAGRQAARALLLRGQVALAREQPAQALEHWRVLAARFPGNEAAQAGQLAAASLHERAGRLKQAVAILESLAASRQNTGARRDAARRLAALRRVELQVTSPRAFATGQQPKLQVVTRNLPGLEVLVYRFDLAAHVRKHRSLDGISNVATEIVEPDARRSFDVPDYQAFAVQRFELPLDVERHGAWIVEVRTAEARSKTLVLRSNLELIARCGRGQALAYVLRDGKPAAGVSVLARSGDGELAKASTGADGVAKLRWQRGVSQLTLLATGADGQLAFARSRLGHGGTSSAQPRGVVYTDRPLYRPGDVVHYRAIARSAVGGSLAVPAGAKAQVRVSDARGQLIHEQEHDVDAYGALDGALSLADEPAIGQYSVNVSVYDRQRRLLSVDGSFHVEDYRRPPFEVTVESDKPLLAIGGSVKLSAQAAYRFGGPVARARVQWYVTATPWRFDAARYRDFAWFLEPERSSEPTGELVHQASGTTDDEGRVTLDWTPPRGGRELRYSVLARVTDVAGATAIGGGSLLSVVRKHVVVIQPGRKAFRVDDPIKGRLLTVSADHRPVSLAGVLILERATRQGWVEVAQQRVTSDEQGNAAFSMQAKRAGQHRLRFEAPGSAGFLGCRGSAEVSVAGESKEQRLTVRVERAVYREGEKARVFIGTPAGGKHVLLTFEAEGVIGHQVVAIAGRTHELELPMLAAYAPNVAIQACCMHEGALHEASDQAVVVEYLDVEVESDKPEARPGDKISVTIRTRDQRGNPIDAAISLAAVDEAVLALREDSTPGLKNRFYSRRRQLLVRGCSSAFRYTGDRLKPLRALLDEQRYEELEKERKRAVTGSLAPAKGGKKSPRPKAPRKPGMPKITDPVDSDHPPSDHNETADAENWSDDAAKQAENGPGGPTQGLSALQLELARLRHRRRFEDTAHWAPSVKTGADGEATLSFELPDNLTRWRFTARGASRGAHVGEATGALVTRQPLLLQVRAPAYLIRGDKARGEIELHSDADRPSVAFASRSRQSGDAPALVADTQLSLAKGKPRRQPLPLAARLRGLQLIEAVAGVEGEGDRVTRPLMVKAQGTRVLRAGAGRLASDAKRRVSLPPQTDRADARLLIGVDPDPDHSLERALDELRQFPYGCFEQTVSRFLPAVAAIHAFRAANKPNDRLQSRYLPIARAGLQRVYAMQQAHGGWGWWGRGRADASMTGYGLLAMEWCRKDGLVPVLSRRVSMARQAAQRLLSQSQPSQRALLGYALALGEVKGSRSERQLRAQLNAMASQRERLSPAAVALTALALDALGAEAMVPVLLDTLRQRAQRDGSGLVWKGDGGFLSGDLESCALATLALARLGGQADRDRVRAGMDALLAKRRGAGWGTTKTSAMALLALAESRKLLATPPRAYTVKVLVNGKAVGELKVDGNNNAGRHELVVPADALLPENEVVLSKAGEGTLYFWYRLEGFRRGKIKPESRGLTVQRVLRQRQTPHAGYTMLRPEARPSASRQHLEALAIGQVATVELTLTSERARDYVMLEDPLPAGVFVEPGAPSGRFDREETRLDRKVFFFTRLPAGVTTIRYQVRARFPGSFHVNPARAELMYEPSTYGHGTSHKLTVLDTERMATKETPDATFAHAVAARRAGKAKQAEPVLLGLLGMPLTSGARAQVTRELLLLRVPTGGAPLLAAYEQLASIAPTTSLSRRSQVAVAEAYLAADKPLRALELLRILTDRYLDDVKRLAGAEHLHANPSAAHAAVGEALERLPATPRALAERFSWAAGFADRSLAEDGLPRYLDALTELRVLSALWPASPHARLAARRRIQLAGHGFLGSHKLAAIEATQYLACYPKAPRNDEVLRALADASFRAGDHPGADAASARLETATYRDGGVVKPSPHRSFATYLRAKIAHSRGEWAKAIAGYRKVAGSYPDAADAVRFYERSVLELPRVVRVKPEQEAQLPLTYRNVESVQLQVYPVDLVTLFMMRGGRDTIGGIDLSGIKPAQTLARELPAATGFDTQTRKLPLGKLKTGAYLVVGRAGGREVSAFVLVSDLTVRVHRERGRTYVHASRNGKPAKGVQVRLAAGSAIIGRGQTDARGVFSLADRGQKLAVIAFDGQAYALPESK